MKISETGKRPEASKSKASLYTYSCLEHCIPDEDAENSKGDANF